MRRKNLLCAVAFNYHDSSVCFAKDNRIILVLEAERIFRRKKMRCNNTEMEDLIHFGLSILQKNVDDISHWALCTLQNPWLSIEDRCPNPPSWKNVRIMGKKRNACIINHHLAHASSFFFSPFDKATIFTCDGGGDCGERITVYSGNDVSIIKENVDVNSFITAKPYDLCSTYLYASPMCEGKLMALAAYGMPTKQYLSKLEELLPILCETEYKTGNQLLSTNFPNLKGTASVSNNDACNFSASVQNVFARHRINDITQIVGRFNSHKLVLSGGACLNLEVNTEVWKKIPDLETFIPPCCDDTGQALGAAAYLITTLYGKRPELELPYLGYGPHSIIFSDSDISKLVQDLLDDKIILLHNSKAEIGPRALGNRSFIARPDKLEIKIILNQKIKGREEYRPLAPVTIDNKVRQYFTGPPQSPYMLHQYGIIADTVMGSVRAGVHYNNTARVQTVNRTTNPFLYSLIKKFGERTGIYVLLNTSLNLKGEPIANALEHTINVSKRIRYNHVIVYNGKVLK